MTQKSSPEDPKGAPGLPKGGSRDLKSHPGDLPGTPRSPKDLPGGARGANRAKKKAKRALEGSKRRPKCKKYDAIII